MSYDETPSEFCPIDIPGQVLNSVAGYHIGCFGLDSDGGTDTFSATVVSGWKIVSVAGLSATEDNGTVNVNVTALPDTNVTIKIPWSIGPDGGIVSYWTEIMVEGPNGVPTNR